MAKPYKNWNNYKQSPKSNPNVDEISLVENLPNYDYTGFRLYFPGEDGSNIDTIRKHVTCFKVYFKNNPQAFSLADITNQKYFSLDYNILLNAEEDICIEWETFKEDLIDNTEYCLNSIGLAMHDTIVNYYEDQKDERNVNIVRCRIVNFNPTLQLKDLKINYFGKLVALKGTVIKAGNVKVVCLYLTFSCVHCSGTILVKQIDGSYTLPKKCNTKGCRNQSNFTPLHTSKFNKTVGWQAIKVQELLNIEDCEKARIPRTLEIELTEDLVKSCIPGDDITVTGIIRARNSSSKNAKNKQNTVFNMYLEAVSLENKKRGKISNTIPSAITFNALDYQDIQNINWQPQLFRLLVQSLCTNIYGHEIIKAGLLLALFGGTKRDNVRAESHVLMVGDPGLGKSQMLKACSSVSPRGVYVCGNTSTSSGLTVTLTREGSEFALEAGALMLADQGCCCIDEFDKMPTQHASLLEAMEQQSISIAKAGIVCTLPTRATILAAANPAGGHYNKAKTISENLKMSSPMLSRFDLVFILLDQPNEQLDLLLTKHVLGMHLSANAKRAKNDDQSNSTITSSQAQPTSLLERLKTNGERIDFIPHHLFRKYIAYAQKYVNPQLTDEAKDILKAFYLSLRTQYKTGDSTPVTTRQLNSLIRLTQARAKAELREEATKEDADDVVEIMKYSLAEVFTNELGLMDTTRLSNGTGMSSRNQTTNFLKLLQRISDNEAKALFTKLELKQLSEQAGVPADKFHGVIQSLNIHGFLLDKGGSKYQLVTADY